MTLHIHPMHARVTCLTNEHVQALARLHSRVLPPEADIAATCSTPSQVQSQMFPLAASDADLRTRLEQIATLQAQLTDLTLQLLHEREQRTEQRLLALEAERTSFGDYPLVAFSSTTPSVSCQPVPPALIAIRPRSVIASFR
jgi:hypothetical protein